MKPGYYISVLLLACSTLAFGQNPGGVSGTRLWMRSDLGTGSTTNNAQVYGWNDQSGNGYNAWVSGNMYYKDNATDNINFNPVHYFNGSSNFNVNNIGIRSPGTPVYDYTIIAVGRREVSGGGMVFGDAQDNGDYNTLSFGYSANRKLRLTHKKRNLTITVNKYDDPDISPFIIQGAFDQNNGRFGAEFRDGNYTQDNRNETTPLGGYSGFRIGSSADPDYDYFTGHMAEVVVYRTLLSDIEKLQVYSYLGIKYGITLTDDLDDDGNANEVISGSVREGDYVASDGSTVIWDFANQGTAYYNQVAGIGRDDGSDLDQRQAKSQDPEALLTIGNSDIFTTNFTNTNSFSADKTFMLWANNGGNNSFTTSGAPSGRAILGRAWRVQETGTVGKVKIQVPASTSSLNSKLPAAGTLDLFVDADGDFTSGAVSHSMVLNGTNWEVELDLADGDYFTFAKGGAELSVTTEGKEQGPTHAVVTVLLPEVNTTGAAFTFDIVDNLTGTAASGSDYAAIPAGAKISVANGAQTGTYTINIIDDAVAEALETIDVSISNPSGTQFFVSQGDVTVTISDNDAGPGGVKNNLNVWLKADLGTSSSTDNTTVSTWTDQSSSGHDGLGDGNPPTYKNNTADNINFNPSLYFDGSDDRLVLDLDDIKSGRGNGNGKHTLIAVGQRTNSSRAYVLGSQGGSYQEELFFGYENNNTARWDNVATALNLSVNNYNSPAESPFMLFGMFDGAGREFEETRDATLTRGTDSYNVAIQGSRSNYIGDIESYSAHYNGKISEIIVYDSTITNLQKQQIYSYLALKYGLGISDDANANATINEVISGSVREGDLVSSDTTVLWEYAVRGSEYFNDVAGIGQDNVSGLLQKQSLSISSDALVRMGLDTIAENNPDNPGAFSADKTFLVWGNNDSAIVFTSYGAPSGSQVLSRKWQVQETGTLGMVRIQVPASTSSLSTKLPYKPEMVLLLDSDDDFTNGFTTVDMTLRGTNWEADVDFSNGDYFTFSDFKGGSTLSVLTHGDEGGPIDVVFKVKIDGVNTSGTAITYDIADAGTGTATSGSDYTAIPAGAKISIANGDSVGIYAVTVVDDSQSEALETVAFYISNPSNPSYPVLSDTAIATITDNDEPAFGGVSDQLIFWLKADAGTNSSTHGQSITSWDDQTNNGNNTSSSGTAPIFEQPSSNYNPALAFGGSGGMRMSNSSDVNASASSQKSFSLVFKTGADIVTRQLLYEEGGGTHGLNTYIEGGELYCNLWVSSSDNAASTTIDISTVYILTFVYNGSSGRWDAYLNGDLAFNDASVPSSLPSHTGGIGIGEINNATQYNGNVDVSSGDGFVGQIMEMGYYNAKALSTTERNAIESYLSIKYGISMSSDYYELGGVSKIWDTSLNSGYNEEISGIGYQYGSALEQKQSGSESCGKLLSIGLEQIATTNQQNTASFASDGNYFLWGNNGGASVFSAAGAASGEFVLQKQWRVAETGTIDSVLVQVPDQSSSASIYIPEVDTLFLLIDKDGDFSTGAVAVPMTKTSGIWTVEFDFDDGDYFTVATTGTVVYASVNGNEAGPVDIEFKLILPQPNNTGVAITYDIADALTGTATPGLDYDSIPVGAQFVVAAGDSTAFYTVVVYDDSRIEGQETVDIIISNPSNPSFPLSTELATATIEDNDSLIPGSIFEEATFWLKADEYTSSTTHGTGVSSWSDASGNSNNASSTGSDPLYNSAAANFNPGISFFSSSEGYLIADNSEINTSTSGAKAFAIAFRTSSDVSTLQTIFEEGGSVNGLNLYVESNKLKVNWWENSNEYIATADVDASTTYVVSVHYDGYSASMEFYVDGVLETSLNGMPSTLPAHSGDVGIGSIQNETQFEGDRDVSSGTTFLGDIMEMLYFNEKVFSVRERTHLDSYLSLKYGVSYNGDYLSSDSSVVAWYNLKNSGFGLNVAGIAEDMQGRQLQKQSATPVLTIGLGTIEVDNASNSANFSTGLDYLIWGDDGGKMEGVDSLSELKAQSGTVDQIYRTWKILETGSVGIVKLAFEKDSVDNALPLNGYGNLYIRIADNDSLTLNPTEVELDVESINGADYYVAEYDFTDSAYFSLVQKGFIIWNGTEWRGGLSAINPHGPSDDPLDEVKPMYVLSGDSAGISESVVVAEAIIDSNAVLQMNPQSCLTLATILNDGSLILRADSSGFAQYNGPAVEATFEQYIDDAGWHLIGSPFSDATWSDLKFSDTNTVLNHPLGGTSLDSCSYCNLWWYDAGADNGFDIGFGSSDAFGTWRSSANVGESFSPDRGWNLWLDEAHGFSSAPWTVYLSGTLNDGDVTQIVNENNAGWNLVANPYPSALDWDVVDDDLAAAGIAGGYHIWDHENTNYAVYGSGTGTLGLTQHIAPFQGFYVQTSTVGAQNSGDVFHDFDLVNTDRPSICTGGLGNFYKSGGSQEIVLQTTHAQSGKKDETIIVLSDETQRGVYPQEDIRKLFTPYKDAPSLYSRMDLQNLAIASVPYPMIQDSIQLGTICKDGSRVTIEAIRTPAGYTIYLEDIKTGQWHRIDEEAYSYTQESGLENRFWLHFGPGSIEAKPWNASNPFSIFVRNDQLVIKTLKSVSSAEWYLTSTSGQVMLTGQIYEGEGFEHEVYIGHLATGTYVFRMKTRDGYFAEKIVIL